jgi:hypothetical protein
MLRTRLAVGSPHDFDVAVAQLDGQGAVRDDGGECAVLVQPAEGDLLTGD